MKFSEQGLEKIENYSSVDLEIEGLEPEDFKDVVVLTVEEAKEISFHLYKLATLYELQILELDPDKKLIKPLAKTYERLNDKICQAMKTKRIARAEAVQLCADYNKTLNRVAEELQRQTDIDICRGMDLDTTYYDMLNKTIKEVAEND